MPKQQDERVLANQEELAQRILQVIDYDGSVEAQPGLHFRYASTTEELHHGFAEPAFCVIAQGSKELVLGSNRFRYDPAHYMINTINLPVTGQVVEASKSRPFLGVRLVLDPAVVTSVLIESGDIAPPANPQAVNSLDVSDMNEDLLDATVRLVRLVDSPKEYRILAPLVIREIVYRLTVGAQSTRMYHLASFGGHEHRMAKAVARLRKDFDKPLRVEEIAREVGMSVSGFHAHFRSVTSMSPLQFLKQIRLQEARRLMLNENLDAAASGHRVGYEDPSHFSREYKRQFGEPPARDIERLRRERTAHIYSH